MRNYNVNYHHNFVFDDSTPIYKELMIMKESWEKWEAWNEGIDDESNQWKARVSSMHLIIIENNLLEIKYGGSWWRCIEERGVLYIKSLVSFSAHENDRELLMQKRYVRRAICKYQLPSIEYSIGEGNEGNESRLMSKLSMIADM